MSQITERIMAEGDWSVSLANLPDELLRVLIDNPFGEIYVTETQMPKHLQQTAALRGMSSFTGVVTRVERDEITDQVSIGGPSNSFWLGDSQGKGALYKTNQKFEAEPVADAIRTLLPASVTEGLIQVPVGAPPNYDGEHFLQTPKEAITFIAEETKGEWRVNPDGSFDFGDHHQLGYVVTPAALLVQRLDVPTEELRAIRPTNLSSLLDVDDLVTEALLIGPGAGTTIVLGEASAPTEYKDPFGNPFLHRGMFNEPILFVDHADDRAQVLVDQHSQIRQQVTVGLDRFEVRRIKA